MKLTEALDSERGTLSPYPSAFLSAALCTQLISEEERMMAVVDGSRTSTPDNLIRTVVAHIIHAQYCNGNAAAKVRDAFYIEYRLELSGRSQPSSPLSSPRNGAAGSGGTMPTLTSSMQSIEQLLLLQTFSRRAQLLREAKEREHLLLPGFADALKTLKLQRKRAQDTMLSTVKRYQLKQIGKIFRRWHEAARASKRAVEMLSTWLRDSHAISTRQIFKAWYHAAQTAKHHREIEFERTAQSEMDKIMKELARPPQTDDATHDATRACHVGGRSPRKRPRKGAQNFKRPSAATSHSAQNACRSIHWHVVHGGSLRHTTRV